MVPGFSSSSQRLQRTADNYSFCEFIPLINKPLLYSSLGDCGTVLYANKLASTRWSESTPLPVSAQAPQAFSHSTQLNYPSTLRGVHKVWLDGPVTVIWHFPTSLYPRGLVPPIAAHKPHLWSLVRPPMANCCFLPHSSMVSLASARPALFRPSSDSKNRGSNPALGTQAYFSSSDPGMPDLRFGQQPCCL